MATPRNRLCGLVAATFTPMTQDNEINLSVIGQYVDYLVKVQGVKNVFVNGTTGEGMSLTVEERKLVAEEWIRQGKGKLDQVIIHVGSLSIKESQQLAKHAANYNASGISVISPFFFKPQSTEALTEFLTEVASAAPSMPFYYYHLPELTGVSLNVVELLDGIEKRIPTFQGLKFTSSDLLDFGQCVHKYKDKFALLYGKDELLFSAMVIGATGAVGSTYNYFGNLCNKMLAAIEREDYNLAREHQVVVQEFIGCMYRFGFGVAENKATMMLVSGIPLGPPRLPLLKCSEEKQAKILAKLKILGILT
ncbi:N-acetylneuraminate lyase isoform X2 [Heptranchias perlo]